MKARNIISLSELKDKVNREEVDTVLICLVDTQGRLQGKRLTAEYFCQSAEKGIHLCRSLLSVDIDMNGIGTNDIANINTGLGDMKLIPDMKSIRLLSWLPATALVICDAVSTDSQDMEVSPRTLLKHQIEKFDAMNASVVSASELEFMVFQETYKEAQAKNFKQLNALAGPYNEDHCLGLTTKEEEVMRAIRNHLHYSGVPILSSHGECGIGQVEVNLEHCNVLTMCDRHSLLKMAVKDIAHMYEHSATFMAKYDSTNSGNSCHIHISIINSDGQNLFYDKSAEHGMSLFMRQFLAGLLHYTEDITWFLAPNVNSYKRFAIDIFAPTRISWAVDNRTSAYRVCGAGTDAVRIECRIPGADVNPYLAKASLLSAGHQGIVNALELPNASFGNIHRMKKIKLIPQTLAKAIKIMKQSKKLQQLFSNDVISHYYNCASWEQMKYNQYVTDWEKVRGYERA